MSEVEVLRKNAAAVLSLSEELRELLENHMGHLSDDGAERGASGSHMVKHHPSVLQGLRDALISLKLEGIDCNASAIQRGASEARILKEIGYTEATLAAQAAMVSMREAEEDYLLLERGGGGALGVNEAGISEASRSLDEATSNGMRYMCPNPDTNPNL